MSPIGIPESRPHTELADEVPCLIRGDFPLIAQLATSRVERLRMWRSGFVRRRVITSARPATYAAHRRVHVHTGGERLAKLDLGIQIASLGGHRS